MKSAKEWIINSARKDPASAIRCKTCGAKPTRWYKLMSTTVYRCELHKKDLVSPVYDQGKISSKGEMIGLEVNPTFEVGISRMKDYEKKTNRSFTSYEQLEEEGRKCPHDEILQEDPEWGFKLMEFIEHMRTDHPLQFSAITYTDESGEHNLYAEHPEEYFRTIQSVIEVKKYYSKTIPKDLVGTDVSANELRGIRYGV